MNNLDYGVIGNCKSAALIGKTGSIEWCCLPDFDSPSLFAKLLDEENGGEFGVEVGPDYRITQSYIDKTNILRTFFSNGTDAFEIIDFMPRFKTERSGYYYPPDIIRYIRYHSGKPTVRFKYDPRLEYAKGITRSMVEEDYIKSYTPKGPYEAVYLYSSLDLQRILQQSEWVLESDHFFLLSYNEKLLPLDLDRIRLWYEKTKVYWLTWVDKSHKFSIYNQEIIRSTLVLKLLTYQKSGAILAAITTSLPETIGEVRNWDYRFCWIRDASMIISILTSLGHYHSAERFLRFIIDIIPYKDEKIQIMYGIRGEKKLTEKVLPWLAGYENSQPVRAGNAAYLQKQNDIYGVLIDVLYNYFKLFRNTAAISEELWTIIHTLVKTVERNWNQPDQGIWEYRSQKQHFTFSKVLCWVALDRGVRIAELFGKMTTATQWARIRERIKNQIFQKGWNPEINAFTQYYGSKYLDAANLLMAYYGFLNPDDPRYVATVRQTKEKLCKDGLMYRYRNEDDFGQPTSSFTVCTFWMIKSLYLIGEKEEAIELFEKVLAYSNHLGLFSEDLDFSSRRLLGNFPQGYSHLALIDTAITINGRSVDFETCLLNYLNE